MFVSRISLSDGLSLALIDQQPGGGRKEGTSERGREGKREGGAGPFPKALMQRTVGEGGASGVWRERRRRGCVRKLAGRDKLCSRRDPRTGGGVGGVSVGGVCLSVCVCVRHRDSPRQPPVFRCLDERHAVKHSVCSHLRHHMEATPGNSGWTDGIYFIASPCSSP